MSTRIDSASRLISASPKAVYRAFAEPGAMERWIPPSSMAGKMLHFDFREGGSYRMRLTYAKPQHGQGKTSEDSDEVEVRLTKLEDGQRIEQEVIFESEDRAFSGIMRMIWTFQVAGNGTLVTVRAENVPEGIRAEDHEAGLNSSLENLARFVEAERIDDGETKLTGRAGTMEYDEAKIEETMLALLGALEFDGGCVWKRYDFDIMERLHARGYISNPRGRQESVDLTNEGMRVAKELAARYFARR